MTLVAYITSAKWPGASKMVTQQSSTSQHLDRTSYWVAQAWTYPRPSRVLSTSGHKSRECLQHQASVFQLAHVELVVFLNLEKVWFGVSIRSTTGMSCLIAAPHQTRHGKILLPRNDEALPSTSGQASSMRNCVCILIFEIWKLVLSIGFCMV